jgi:hypothetical protein
MRRATCWGRADCPSGITLSVAQSQRAVWSPEMMYQPMLIAALAADRAVLGQSSSHMRRDDVAPPRET